MTGYGSHTFEVNDAQFTLEMRSVNNRYLDIVTKIPRSFMYLELDMKKLIQSYFKRGRIELFLQVSGQSFTEKSLHVDWDLLDQYMSKFEQMKKTYPVGVQVSADSLMMNDNIFTIEENDDITDDVSESILQAIKTVCEKLKDHRISEGKFLLDDIKMRLESVRTYVGEVTDNQESILNHYRDRLLERIKAHLDDHIEVDDSTLIKDVAVLAEKGDITEEVTRLHSHIEHFGDIISKDEVIGRKLDFIAQEMHREINTIGAKSVDPHLSQLVVKLKSEVEKIKEQIQNIE